MRGNSWTVNLLLVMQPLAGHLQESRNRDETMIHGIGTQSETLERERPEQGLGARVAEHDDRRPRAAPDFDLGQRYRVLHLAPVSTSV